MTVGDTRSLFGRILVVVAREDDETACSVLLQRAHEARVVFATDRAPASEFFWRGYGSRQQYAAVRHGKTRNVHVLGFHPFLWAAQQERGFHRSGGLRRRSEWSRSSKPSRLGFNAGSIVVRPRSVHGFARLCCGTTNL